MGLRFKVDWLEAPGVQDPAEAATWAEISIELNGQVISRAFDERHFDEVPLVPARARVREPCLKDHQLPRIDAHPAPHVPRKLPLRNLIELAPPYSFTEYSLKKIRLLT
jgi:hypothetical protein